MSALIPLLLLALLLLLLLALLAMLLLLLLPNNRSSNAGVQPVSSAEGLLAGVSQQALGFCADQEGDGVISLGEGCLIVSIIPAEPAGRLQVAAGTCIAF